MRGVAALLDLGDEGAGARVVVPEDVLDQERAAAAQDALDLADRRGDVAEVMGGDLGGDTRFLQKPYPPPRLAQAVRECLDVA